MYKMTVTFEDWNENEITEDFYFNLTKSEVALMYAKTNGRIGHMLINLVAEKDFSNVYKFFSELVDMSYGVRTSDGRSFLKTEQALAEFKGSNAYDKVMDTLFATEEASSDFVNGIFPQSLRDLAEKNVASKEDLLSRWKAREEQKAEVRQIIDEDVVVSTKETPVAFDPGTLTDEELRALLAKREN